LLSRWAAGALALSMVALAGPAQAETTVTDVAAQAGIAETVNDGYGNSMVFDYNRDGVADLLLSRHMLAPTELFRGNSGGTFTLVQALPSADRHYCAAADFNADGRPDFYCTIGADKGTATNKSNELWLQGLDGSFASVAGAWGAADPMGRGRDVAAADFNNDGRPDLFVGNGFPVSSTNPSPNRLYLNTGTSFTDASADLGALKSGGICVLTGDYNADGRLDIFVCGRNNHLYYAKPDGTYADKAKAFGMTGQWANGAVWGDFNHDARLDLAYVGDTGLFIFTNTGTGFTTTITPLAAGRNVAIADVDQDGNPDLYVVQGRAKYAEQADLLLMGNGDSTFHPYGAALPAVSGAGADGNDVAVIPNYNGRPALLVTNGAGVSSTAGPRQLLEFTG